MKNLKRYPFIHTFNPVQKINATTIRERLSRAPHELAQPHRTEFYMIFLFTEGHGTHSVDFNNIAVKPGHILFIGKGQVHHFDPQETYDGNTVVFTEDFFCRTEAARAFLQHAPLFNDPLQLSGFNVGERYQELVTLYHFIVAVKIHPFFHMVLLLPLYAVLLYTMGIPGWAKIFGGSQVIERYVNMFRDSFIAQLPGGTTLMIYVLGVLELAIPVLLIISLLKGEFRLTAGKTWFNYALVLSIFTFGMLCFGLAVLFNFAGSANLVFYPIFTLLALVSINQLTQQATLAGK